MELTDFYTKYNLSDNVTGRKNVLISEAGNQRRFFRALDARKKEYDARAAEIDKDENLTEAQKVLKKRDLASFLFHCEDYYLRSQDLLQVLEKAVKDIKEPSEDDERTEEERINEAYFLFIYKRRLISIYRKEDMARGIKSPELRSEKFAKVIEEREELDRAYSILSNPELRKEYDRELQKQKYLDKVKENKEARINLSEIYIKDLLGEEFDPDMSKIEASTDKTVKKLQESGEKPFEWTARLYEAPERLFVGRSSYTDMPDLDSDVYAFRYGTIEFASLFKKDGTPSYRDSLSEIIGVTKVDQNGDERTDFVIAPLTDDAEIKEVTMEEYQRLVETNQAPLIIKTVEEVRFERAQQEFVANMRRKKEDERRKPATKTKSLLAEIKEGLSSFFIGEEEFDYAEAQRETRDMDFYEARSTAQPVPSYKPAPPKKLHVYIPRTVKHLVKPEDVEFFSTVYFSDYLVDNAVKNNAGYLGSYRNERGERTVSFNSPMERERIAACFYANKNPGLVVQRGRSRGIFSNSEVTANNTRALFSFFRETQRDLVAKERAKTADKDYPDSQDL